jgi:hypothetical protein
MLWLADMTYSPFNTAAGGGGRASHDPRAGCSARAAHTRATRGVETCLHAGQSALTL